jgi:hypothetical protein
MARKCIKILIAIIIELYIFIYFAHSDLIMIPHFSELDEVQNSGHQKQELKTDPKLEHQKLDLKREYQTLPGCLTTKYEDCERRRIPEELTVFGLCLYDGF